MATAATATMTITTTMAMMTSVDIPVPPVDGGTPGGVTPTGMKTAWDGYL